MERVCLRACSLPCRCCEGKYAGSWLTLGSEGESRRTDGMHEFAATQSLVQAVLQQLEGRGVEQVVTISLRRGSAFSEEALRQAYAAASAGTMLEKAELLVETVNLTFSCSCGHAQVITNDDLIGHMFVCPACGIAREVDDSHDLSVSEITVEDDEQPEPSS
jgi:Zn finger protein HypA/HybF involved in hydrogenase expression